MQLAERVNTTFRNCLFKEEELLKDGKPPEGYVSVEGITLNVGLHPGRLEESREEVKSLLNEMAPEFHRKTGGGWTFLNMCVDKHGKQWTDFQLHCQELLFLALGLGMAQYQLPRESWSVFPGGMPYIMFDTDGGLCPPSTATTT